jgi:hypothetical protein
MRRVPRVPVVQKKSFFVLLIESLLPSPIFPPNPTCYASRIFAAILFEVAGLRGFLARRYLE